MLRMIRSSFVVAMVLGAVVPAFAQPAKPAAAMDDLSLLPVDSELVMGIDFQQLSSSSLWKQFVEPQLAKSDVRKALDEFKTNCDVDAMKIVTKIVVGIKGIGGDKVDAVIVAHGVPKAKLVACYGKLLKGKKADQDVTRDGDVLIVKPKNGQSSAFAFVDDSTAVIVIGTGATSAGVKAVVKGTSALKASAAMVELYKKTNTDTLWMIMNGNSKAFDALAASGIKPKALHVSLNVTHELDLDLRVLFGTTEEAKKLVNTFDGQIKQVASMFDNIEIKVDGSDMRVRINLKGAKLEALAKKLDGMTGKP